MANEVTGKSLKYFQNGIEQAIKGHNFDRAFDMASATSTGTAGAGKESVSLRATTTLKIDTDLLSALGNEVSNGTLTAKQKYLVTAGTVDGHALGTIFEADGTEECTAENKVKALGSKITGKTMSVTIGGAEFLATAMDYNSSYDTFPATTSATSGPNKEIVTGRCKHTTKFEALMYRATADRITNDSPAVLAVVLTFAPGITVTGNAILNQMSINEETEGICKVTYNAEWQGVPVEAGLGYLALAVQQSFKIIYEEGATTNKEIAGSIILHERSISADIEGDVTLSYTGHVNGAITPAVYS